MLGGLSRTATAALRQLIDAGTLSNLPAGFKARGLRIADDDSPLQPGEFRDVDAPYDRDWETVYMACEDHSEATDLKKCDCKKTDNEFTELSTFIKDFGEEIPDDWKIIDEEKVVDEHEDFDFEAELNNIANNKTELASTGTARPNQRSVQNVR